MATNEAARTSWIQKAPDVCGGDACIRRTRIPVWLLVQAKRMGLSDEEQLVRFNPPLSQADLEAAWKYYSEHPGEIDEAIRDNEESYRPAKP